MCKAKNRKTVHPDRRSLSFWWRVTQFNSLATLRRRQCAPEAMDARGRHLSKILDVLRATKFDLKERRVVIDVECLELPEHDGSIFRRELLVLAIVIECSRQYGIALFRGELLKSADAGFQPHLLGQLGEVPFRLCRRQTTTLLKDRHVELEYAVGADPERRIGVLIGDLEMVAKILLAAEFAGFDGLFVVDRILGKGSFAKSSRQGSGH
jgi:hypothetical protein